MNISLDLAGSPSQLVGNTGMLTAEFGYPGSVMPGSPSPCTTGASSIGSNFNGTPIPGGAFVWFNSNFTAHGVQDGTVITFQNSTIQFTAGGTQYKLAVPNAQILFTSSVSCASTYFDSATNTWRTTLPVAGSDEIFLSGLAFRVPSAGLQGGINPVTWQGTFGGNNSGVTVQWKWGAAVYNSFSTDYNALGVKATHSGACGMNNSDHAGTPENFKGAVVGGARGGGGSNFTGSWSGTASAAASCPAF